MASSCKANYIFREPFKVNKEDELILLCRYLVETSDEDHIEYSQDCENDTDQIKTIFKKLVHYTLMSPEQITEYHESISQVHIIFNDYKLGN